MSNKKDQQNKEFADRTDKFKSDLVYYFKHGVRDKTDESAQKIVDGIYDFARDIYGMALRHSDE